MTREEFIGIMVLIMAVIVIVNLTIKGWDSSWGVLVKLFFFPVV